jgi:hypothetical protein
MTPKEKAIDLVEDMHDAPEMGYNEHAKQCALIAVDEIMNVIIGSYDYELEKIYWKEVKQEIEKL